MDAGAKKCLEDRHGGYMKGPESTSRQKHFKYVRIIAKNLEMGKERHSGRLTQKKQQKERRKGRSYGRMIMSNLGNDIQRE